MTTIGDRIRALRTEKGMTQGDLAKVADVSIAAVSKWEKNQAEPKGNSLSALATTLDVSMEFLVSGENAADIEDPFSDPFDPNTLIPAKSHIGILEHHDTTNSHDRVTRYEVRLAAGNNGSTAEWIVRENDDDPILFCKGWFKARRFNPDSLRGMYVRGDSMEPYLYDHDTVIIDVTETEIIDGEVYAVVYKKRFYVKELQLMDGGVRIVSRNDKYPPMEALDAEWKNELDFQVLGRVVWRGG